MATRAALCALVALLLSSPRAAAAGRLDAPLGVDTPGPLRALFLDMPLADARGAEGVAVDLRWSMANSWSVPTALARGGERAEVQLDAQIETLRLAVTLPWQRLSGSALAARLGTTVEARAVGVWGGWSDGGIESWHALVRAVNFSREAFPRDAVAVRLADAGGARLVDARSGRLALGDVVIRTALRVAGAGPLEPASRLAVALRLDVKLPTGSPGRLGGSGGLDAGAGVAATLSATRWLTGHAMASLRAVSDLPRSVVQPRRFQAGLDLSLVARAGAFALVLEDRISSPLFEGGWALADGQAAPRASAFYSLLRPHNQVSVGLRWREVTAWLSEDFTPLGRDATDGGPGWFYESNAPDVVLGVAWARGL